MSDRATRRVDWAKYVRRKIVRPEVDLVMSSLLVDRGMRGHECSGQTALEEILLDPRIQGPRRDESSTDRLWPGSHQDVVSTRRMASPPKDIGKDQWRDNRRIRFNDKLRCLNT
jgi:hypothetical protein